MRNASTSASLTATALALFAAVTISTVAGASDQLRETQNPHLVSNAGASIADQGPAHQNRTTGAHCGPLTRELVQRVAVNNTVMVTAIDRLMWGSYSPSFVENVRAANISYWLVAALDPETSLELGAAGLADHCFNAAASDLRRRQGATGSVYVWGSYQWALTTWRKVQVVRAAYELAVHVIYSDADVVWFADPLPYFQQHVDGRADALFSTDSLATRNRRGDVGLEKRPGPDATLNSGVFLIWQRPTGRPFLDAWRALHDDPHSTHDQDGLNTLVRGFAYKGDRTQPMAPRPEDPGARYLYAAGIQATAVGLLPVSMFANTYTYVNARLWEKLDHPLFAVHWVWGGSTLESKRQCMRDAMKFHDEPEYYTAPYLMTFDLEQLQTPLHFNAWMSTEKMIRFHILAANHQLQQTYYALAAALVGNRTLVMPRFLCHCSKNWFQTHHCRINREFETTFPFVCSLSQLLRVKRLQAGFSLPDNTEYSGHRVFVREYSFLENAKVPQEVKSSFLEVVPSPSPRPPGLQPDQLLLSSGPSPRGYGRRITVAAPLSDRELRGLLAQFRDVRVVHLPQPRRTLAGFARQDTHDHYDKEIQKYVTYWCCRAPTDMQAMQLPPRVQLVALPPQRYANLPPAGEHSCYVHQLGPFPLGGLSKEWVSNGEILAPLAGPVPAATDAVSNGTSGGAGGIVVR